MRTTKYNAEVNAYHDTEHVCRSQTPPLSRATLLHDWWRIAVYVYLITCLITSIFGKQHESEVDIYQIQLTVQEFLMLHNI